METPDITCSGLAFGPVTSISGVLRVEPQRRLLLSQRLFKHIRGFASRTPAGEVKPDTCFQAYQGFCGLNPSCPH
nr:MAG TPA: hypothetical protein [Caudoviricetes sp.]